MSNQIFINFDEVYGKTAELRQRIDNELRELDMAYRQAQSDLRNMDGKANDAFVETIAENQRKARVTAETMRKLIMFIENSAREVERNEQLHARVFASSRVNITRRRRVQSNA